MSRQTAIIRGRRAAEKGMADTCSIRRRTGETTNPVTGEVTRTYGGSLYAGRCRVQQPKAQAAQSDAGEDFQLLLRLEVQLPMSVTGLQVGDEVTITASAYDPDLPGRTFQVRDLAYGTHKTSRRVGVTERTG